jgi:hypothetical protein
VLIIRCRIISLNDEYPASLLSAVSHQEVGKPCTHTGYDWQSPLTTQWIDVLAGTCLEMPIRALGRMMQKWVTAILNTGEDTRDPTKASLRELSVLRKDLERFLNVRILVSNADTAMLSCCQWAARVMLKVEQQRITIHAAAADTIAHPRLVTCLRMTDLDGLWGANRGMLFWVVCICHRATSRRCFPLLTTGLLSRFAHIVALSQKYRAVALEPVHRLEMFEKLCA